MRSKMASSARTISLLTWRLGASLRRPSLELMSSKPKIYLSSPHLGTQEFEFVREAFATNWIAPLGPHVDAFEREFGERLNYPTEDGGRRADGGGLAHGTHGTHGRIFDRRERKKRRAADGGGRRTEG